MAGRIRLAVTGIQDEWLTGEPEFSYFVANYKRHTRFSTEAVEMPFDGKCDFSGSVECRIPQNVGDLVRSTMLKIKLGNLSADTSTEKYRYNTPAALSIIKYVDLVIGGQIIERLTGDYIYMYNQLHNNKDDVNQTLYFLSGHGEHLQVSDSYNTFYVTLPFYFYRNPSLAIPVCAITKQLVEVRVTFKDINDDVTFKYTINGSVTTKEKITEGSIHNVSLITDFYFVTEEERNFLLTRPMEYIISQLQVSKLVYKPNESKKSALLKFTNPVKELFFLAKEKSGSSDQLLDTTITDQEFSTLLPGKRSDYRLIKNIKFACNGETIFDQSGQYLAYEQSLRHHTGCPDPAFEFYTYSFSLRPEQHYPSGQLNMSRIIHKKLDIELDETSSTRDIDVSVYALNYNVLHVASGLVGLKF